MTSDADLLDANETLRKCLVKISFAAAGIQKQMDDELQTLRELIRNDAIEEDIHDQVEAIARVLRELDEESQNIAASLTQEELLDNLRLLINADYPQQQRKVNQILNKSSPQNFIQTLQKIGDIFPRDDIKPKGLFSKLFHTKEPEQESPQSTIESLTGTISQLLNQLHTASDLKEKMDYLQERLQTIHSLPDFPPILEEISSIILDISFTDQLKFETFLRELGQKLDFVQQLIINNVQAQGMENEAASELNKEMRDHVQQLHANIRHADSLKDLQDSVQSRLEKVIKSLDNFNLTHETFIETNQKQLCTMEKKLSESRQDIQVLQQKLRDQQYLAETDALTKLPNRYAFQRKMEEEYARWRRYRNPLSVAIADVDHFKSINDNYGHDGGDKVLANIAQTLNQGLRESDLVARYGGEEFIIIMPETILTKATKAINKLRQKIADHSIQVDGKSIHVTLSFGVSELEDDDPIADVIKRADNALYRAKEKGRNQVCCEMKEV